MENPKTILITGGNRGIGRGLVDQLSPFHEVYYSVRRKNTDHPQEGTVIEFDVTDMTSIKNAMSQIDGKIDILINNAGILPDYQTPALDADLDQIFDAFNVNTVGPLRVCRAVVPKMARGGRIINISSGMGQLSEMGSGAIAYRLSKTALNALTKVLSNELRSLDISVNSICPGWVQTEMGGPGATRTVDESVSEIVKFALSDPFPNGLFFRDSRLMEW